MTTLTKNKILTVNEFKALSAVDKIWYEPVYDGTENIKGYKVIPLSEVSREEKQIKEMFAEIRTDLNRLSKKDFVDRADVLEMIEDCYGKLSKADFIQVIKNL